MSRMEEGDGRQPFALFSLLSARYMNMHVGISNDNETAGRNSSLTRRLDDSAGKHGCTEVVIASHAKHKHLKGSNGVTSSGLSSTRKSPLYVFSAVTIVVAVFYFSYEIAALGRKYYEELRDTIRPPWLPFHYMGSKGVDTTDAQWYYFITAIPYALPVLLVFVLFSRRLHASALNKSTAFSVVPSTTEGAGTSVGGLPPSYTDESRRLHIIDGRSVKSEAREDKQVNSRKRLEPLYRLHIICGILVCFAISGPNFLFGLVFIFMNYYFLAMQHGRMPYRTYMTIMWVSHIAVLYLNSYTAILDFYSMQFNFMNYFPEPLIPWTVHFNMAVMRMIAFNTDISEASKEGDETLRRVIDKHARTCIECAVIRDENQSTCGMADEAMRCYRCRMQCPRPLSDYTLLSYLGYIFYPPLLIAGPMSSFNAYVSFLYHPTRAFSRRAIVRYAVRVVGNLVVLAAMMHYIYAPSMIFTKTWAPLPEPNQMTPFLATPFIERLPFYQKGVVFILALAFAWSKFSVIWKTFRLVALLDGVEPPEDMPRCFASTVSIQSFWRDWHASFNQWIVRYMYIPMGGSRTKMFSIFPIFFFIAVWHDIDLRLLYWAFLICICLLPELLVTQIAGSNLKWVVRLRKRTTVWFYLRVIGCQMSMLFLVIVNLVGFVLGTTRTEHGVKDMFFTTSLTFGILTSFFFFCAANMAIESQDQRIGQAQALRLKYGLTSH